MVCFLIKVYFLQLFPKYKYINKFTMNVLIKLVYMCYMCNKWPIKLDNYLCMLYEKQRDKRVCCFILAVLHHF